MSRTLLLSVLLVAAVSASFLPLEDPDMHLDFKTIVERHNYPFEQHTITTVDGYILTVFRIPGKKGESLRTATAQKRPVIYLQHGLLDSSDTWLMNDESHSPAFVLANLGYDIWLGNSRGNKYSRAHTSLNPNPRGSKFWDFNFEEMGQYDITSVINYVTSYTGQKKVAYIGHSQGTTQMFTALSENLAYFQQKVSIFLAWAPVATLNHCGSKIINDLAKAPEVTDALAAIGMDEFLPYTYRTDQKLGAVCTIYKGICDFEMKMFADTNPKIDNQERLPVFEAHFPSGTSLQSMNHYAQIIRTKMFGTYKAPLARGKSKPYNLSAIHNFPIALFSGSDDELAAPGDVAWLYSQISTTVVFNKEYTLGHLSFLLSYTMPHLTDSITLLQQYHPSADNVQIATA